MESVIGVRFMNINLPKISIIVPVYNVELCMRKCIDSILAQTFKDFELILVNDGSTDGSGKICNEYSLKDKRIRIINKENGGLSSARNAGIKAALGEFLGFVDSDDYISPDMYNFLFTLLNKTHADVASCGLYNCYANKIIPQCKSNHSYLLNGEGALALVLEGEKLYMSAVNKLYRRNLFEKTCFPLGKLYEDAFTIPSILADACLVAVETAPMYFYVHRAGTITTSDFNKNDLDIVEAHKKNLDLVRLRFPSLESRAMFRYLWAYAHVLDKMSCSANYHSIRRGAEYRAIVSVLRANTSKILANPYFSCRRKIMATLLFVNSSVYAHIVQYSKRKSMKLFD